MTADRPPGAVYRSTHPDVLARWREIGEEGPRWQAAVEAVFAEAGLGDRKLWYDDRDGLVLGCDYDGGAVPEGWRVDPRTGYLTPRRSTATGKKIARRLDSIVYPDPRNLPGMPKHAYPERGIGYLTVGYELIGDAVYALWALPIQEPEELDTRWSREKLSAYFHAKEAEEATQ